jgi:hypothetical protein
MKKLYAAAFAFVVSLSMIMSATALEYKTIYRQNGMSAYADWTEINGDINNDTYLSVTETDDGTDVYLSIWTYDASTGNSSYKYGYNFIQDDVFSIDKKLNSASLENMQIDLYQWYCDENGICGETPAGTATIKADWTGTGDISKYGDYIAKGSDSSSSRNAIATGSINGDDIGTSAFAGLAKFKSVYMDMKK